MKIIGMLSLVKRTKEKEELYKAVNEVLRKEKLKEKSDG